MKEKIIEKIRFLLSVRVRPVEEYRDSKYIEGKGDVWCSIGEITFLKSEPKLVLVKGVNSGLTEDECCEVANFVEEQMAIIGKQEMEDYLESREIPLKIVRTKGVPYESLKTMTDESHVNIKVNMGEY